MFEVGEHVFRVCSIIDTNFQIYKDGKVDGNQLKLFKAFV